MKPLGKACQENYLNRHLSNDYGFERFCNITLKTLDKYAPRKAKHAGGNHMSFMTNDLSENIMKKSRLRSKYLKIIMKKQETLYQINKLLRVFVKKTKSAYYDERKVSDNKRF